jgi:DNA repair protein RadD
MVKKRRNPKQLDIFGNGHHVLVEKPELRPYQLQGVEEMRAFVNRGYLRIILTMPTGGGKTVVSAYIIDSARQLERRVLFVVHRIELINQTARQLARFGVTDIGVIRANDERTNPDAPVQIASIDTLRNRDKPSADIIFIDECHRAIADSYKLLFDLYPAALHIGLTASPFRIDNQGLGEIYQAIVTCALPSQLIADGFIQEPRVFAAPMAADISDVEYSEMSHDYHNKQLASAMMKGSLVGNIVEEWKRHAQKRRTVVFAVNVEHSKRICEEFIQEGVPAAHIDSQTPSDERTLAQLKLEKNEISVICNVDVLSEGWDQPSVNCGILARPTSSLRLHMQQCGRILRPWDVSNDPLCDAPSGCIILDHAGNIERHGMPTQDRHFDLLRGEVRKEDAPTLHTCKKCYTMWTGTSRICPECGVEKPVEDRKPIAQDESIILKEVDPRKIFTKADEERQYFIRELQRCRERGNKPGFASHRFKDKYGRFPPFMWSNQAKQMYNADADWQKAASARSQRAEHWQQHMADKKTRIEEEVGTHVKDEGFTEEPQENQNWWNDEDIPF